MNLTTDYLGLKLAHPFMPGASPLAHDLDTVLRLEDAGASAITLHSLFEEQINAERYGLAHLESLGNLSPEAPSFFPDVDEFPLGPERYLEHLSRIKQRVSVPVIASLNGTTPEGWLEYAKLIQYAGADALELNFYHVATDIAEESGPVEQRVIDIVTVLTRSISIPVAVKLSPFYSSLPNLASRIADAGASGLVLFNRFYQPDIDPEQLETVSRLRLSDSSELLLRLRWMAILSGRVDVSLAVSGGVHEGLDAIKAVMAGASAVQIVSALLRHGPSRLAEIRSEFERWAVEHEYTSVAQMCGSMSLLRCPNPAEFERGNYVRILQSWRSQPTIA